MPAQEATDSVISNRYELRSQLGRGGMGVVWRARDTLLQREVAVKEVQLPAELSGSDRDAMEARVLREARAAGRLSHPSVVTVYDVVRDRGRAYIVMELVNAPTLAEVVASDGPLEPAETARIGLQILGALEKAHSEGIVHRDVKPANVMVTPEGPVKLADFGIASLKGDPKITSTGILLGSPSYMAPEQAQGEQSGAPADLWALGATLYHAVEGEAPFDRGQPIPTLTAVVYDDPRPPRRAGPLADPIAALLSKSPEDRPEAAEVRRALERVASGGGARAAAAAAEERTTEVAAPPPERDVWAERRAPEPEERLPPAPAPVGGRGRRSVVAALATLLLALGAVMVYGVVTRDDDPGTQSRPERSGDRSGARGGGDDAAAGREGANEGTDGGEEGAGGLPANQDPTTAAPSDWVPFTDEASGFSISHPPDWTVEPQPTDEDSVDFHDPDSGTYMRVDWTDSPGPSPEQAWLDFEPGFAARHDDYQRIQITPTTFQGFDAAVWEFTYSDGGVTLHAVDLGFVTGDYGFALNFQTHADDWAASQDLYEAFKASFQAP